MGVSGAVLGGSAKTLVLGSAPDPHENSKKKGSEKVANGHMIYHFFSNRHQRKYVGFQKRRRGEAV